MEMNGIPNSVNYNTPPKMISQESTLVKLPLAPIVSTPPDRIRSGNARRGSAIFSPTQTLDQNHQKSSPAPVIVHKESTRPDPNPNPNPDPDPDPPTSKTTKYRECLRNHAANIGGHVVDGCGEFMPSGDEGTPESLRCNACDCHRNFHRKEIESESHYYANSNSNNNHQHQYQYAGQSTPSSQQKQKQNHTYYNSQGPTPTAMLNFGGGKTAESSSEDLNAMTQPSSSSSGSKKRFRTKFSKEQKQRMSDFAEKLEWRMHKKDEDEMHKFCNEVGVKREVFKVFMHNCKQASKKRQITD